MAKAKLVAQVKLQLPAGKATAGPPVGSSLGPHGINIGAFVKEFNEKTAQQAGLVIPVVISIYQVLQKKLRILFLLIKLKRCLKILNTKTFIAFILQVLNQ